MAVRRLFFVFHLSLLLATIASADAARFALLDGMRVHYKIMGHGRSTLVFVHGWGSDMSIWREQVAHFQSKARVVLIDLPGHGASDKPETTYSMKLLARAIRAVLDDAGVQRAILIGHSMGTPVIRQFDRMYPFRSRALVAVDGALRNSVSAEAVAQSVSMLRGSDYRAVVAKRVDEMATIAAEPLRDEIKATAARVPQYVLISTTEEMYNPEVWKDDKIVVPLLVINQRAPFWTSEYEQSVRNLALDVDYQTIDGVDHFLMLEKPGEFNKRLENWLVAKKLLK